MFFHIYSSFISIIYLDVYERKKIIISLHIFYDFTKYKIRGSSLNAHFNLHLLANPNWFYLSNILLAMASAICLTEIAEHDVTLTSFTDNLSETRKKKLFNQDVRK